jgi:hypothetical protein
LFFAIEINAQDIASECAHQRTLIQSLLALQKLTVQQVEKCVQSSPTLIQIQPYWHPLIRAGQEFLVGLIKRVDDER